MAAELSDGSITVLMNSDGQVLRADAWNQGLATYVYDPRPVDDNFSVDTWEQPADNWPNHTEVSLVLHDSSWGFLFLDYGRYFVPWVPMGFNDDLTVPYVTE